MSTIRIIEFCFNFNFLWYLSLKILFYTYLFLDEEEIFYSSKNYWDPEETLFLFEELNLLFECRSYTFLIKWFLSCKVQNLGSISLD